MSGPPSIEGRHRHFVSFSFLLSLRCFETREGHTKRRLAGSSPYALIHWVEPLYRGAYH